MFRPREVIFSMVFSHLGTGCKGSPNSYQQQEEKGAKSIIFYGFQKLLRHFRGAILGLLRPSEVWCFPAGR